jgi:hypothetical protein
MVMTELLVHGLCAAVHSQLVERFPVTEHEGSSFDN